MRLKARDQGMAAATEQGRYCPIDVADALSAMTSEGQVDEARASEFFGNALTKTAAAVQRDNPRIVFFGEVVAWLRAEGKIDSVLRLEQMWNGVAQADAVEVR
jgi:hypothetical protein